VVHADTWTVDTRIVLIVAKAVACGCSISAFRGRPIFPAMFIGTALGSVASHQPGLVLVPAVAKGIGVMSTVLLELPLASTLLAVLLLASDGLAVTPLVILTVVVAYVLSARLPQQLSDLRRTLHAISGTYATVARAAWTVDNYGAAVLATWSDDSPTWLKLVATIVGLAIVGAVLMSTIETVVLTRNSFTRITRATFAVTNRLLVHRWRSQEWADNLRGIDGPVALVSPPLVWMVTVIIGFTLIFWGADSGTLERSFEISGSSVITLGFAAPTGGARTWLAFIEAVVGLGLLALPISYLPTI
jgi:hypothetical protein